MKTFPTDSSIGSTYELQGDSEQAVYAYEQALRHNYQSIQALNAISNILRVKEDFPRAVEYLQTMLKIDATNGEVWGSLGHCFLMMEDLQQAYHAYQNALFHLRDPKVRQTFSSRPTNCSHTTGAQTLVWHWDPL